MWERKTVKRGIKQNIWFKLSAFRMKFYATMITNERVCDNKIKKILLQMNQALSYLSWDFSQQVLIHAGKRMGLPKLAATRYFLLPTSPAIKCVTDTLRSRQARPPMSCTRSITSTCRVSQKMNINIVRDEDTEPTVKSVQQKNIRNEFWWSI